MAYTTTAPRIVNIRSTLRNADNAGLTGAMRSKPHNRGSAIVRAKLAAGACHPVDMFGGASDDYPALRRAGNVSVLPCISVDKGYHRQSWRECCTVVGVLRVVGAYVNGKPASVAFADQAYIVRIERVMCIREPLSVSAGVHDSGQCLSVDVFRVVLFGHKVAGFVHAPQLTLGDGADHARKTLQIERSRCGPVGQAAPVDRAVP